MSSSESGFYRLHDIIGRAEVTPEQAAKNREAGKGRKSPCPAISPILPFSKSKLWDLVKQGKFPAPSKQFGPGITVWSKADIHRIVEKAA